MNIESHTKLKWLVSIILLVILSMGTIFLVYSGASAVPNEAVAADIPDYLPILSHVLPTPTPTPSPTPEPVPPPTSLDADPYACCFDTSTITNIVHAGDERLFVLQREGIIRIVHPPNGQIQQAPFLDITSQVQHNNWEEGLLGLAFHPNYSNNRYFYITFTPAGTDYIVLERYQVKADDPNQADPNSAVRMMSIDKPDEVHHSGDIKFGPDGYLYFPVGDGGPDPVQPRTVPGDPNNHGQRIDEALSSILRIDVDQSGGILPDGCTNGFGYTVPADNPYVDGPGGNCDEAWNRGLRNPWRISFDRQTGDLYISDVGEWEREEINLAPAGTGAAANYGWHCWEGTFDYAAIFPIIAGDCADSGYTFPIIEFDHDDDAVCSIIGGYVYRGSQIPGLQGHYIYADFCRHDIFRSSAADGWNDHQMLHTSFFISTFGEDVHGEIYFGGWSNDNSKTLWKLKAP